MSINATPSWSCQGGSLSCNVTTIVAVIAAMTFSASGAAPTPLYQEYQSHFGLTPFMVTVIFAAYVLCLLLALLTVGSLSDYIGRRPGRHEEDHGLNVQRQSGQDRSEEHTSELQSLTNLVCRLLLEKKKKTK